MSKIIDLGLFVKEPLVFKGLDGTEYSIPGQVSTKFVLKFSHFEQEAKKIATPEDGIKKMQEMVADILSLDTSKKVTVKYVQDKFDDIRMLQAIIREFGNHLRKIASDPN